MFLIMGGPSTIYSITYYPHFAYQVTADVVWEKKKKRRLVEFECAGDRSIVLSSYLNTRFRNYHYYTNPL